mmetsp:Transcript_43491/g.111228  ORF Transcript_43491/g.111228 Transcript_43491/m.111228 type:complete len:157 (+) Transcript_43491:288-758(+)
MVAASMASPAPSCRQQLPQASFSTGSDATPVGSLPGAVVKQLSSGSRTCAHVDVNVRAAECDDGCGDALLRGVAAKMPAGAALAMKPTPEAGAYTRDRIQVPRGNQSGMAELMGALKVANDLHKEGTLSAEAYADMCNGIQRKMDSLVCLWVRHRS